MDKLLNLEVIDVGLSKIVNQFSCSYAILYTASGLIISDHYMDIMDIRAFEEKIGSKINEDLEFFQRLKDEDVKIDDRVALSEDRTEYVKSYSIISGNIENTFYIGISAPTSKINEIKIELEKFRKILQSTFM